MTQFTLVDVVPQTHSNEIQQDSEPSIAVNPQDPLQVEAGFVFVIRLGRGYAMNKQVTCLIVFLIEHLVLQVGRWLSYQRVEYLVQPEQRGYVGDEQGGERCE